MTREISLDLGRSRVHLTVPKCADVLSMPEPTAVAAPERAIEEALLHPIGSPSLADIVRQKLSSNPAAKAVVVISDNTRPVPYRGESGILWPVVRTLLDAGVRASDILILVATGTHRALSSEELDEMLDPRVFEHGIRIENHDCRSGECVFLCKTTRGSRVFLNRRFLEADLRILTGLVESHFMAGASGGRKSVCPGLISEDSTYVFHGPSLLASPEARDLVLDGNPVHEEALEVAEAAGVDFIVNVTLNSRMQLTGVFAGDLRWAHESAVEHLKEYVTIPVRHPYDLVVTHAGFVGVNHYQAAKAAVVALPALASDAPRMLMIADHTDPEPLGSLQYRTVLHLLRMFGPERWRRLIFSADWTFIPEQWQVQMWAKVFDKVKMEHFVYASAGLSSRDYCQIPGVSASEYLQSRGRLHQPHSLDHLAQVAMDALIDELRTRLQREPTVAVLQDGPYGIVVTRRYGRDA